MVMFNYILAVVFTLAVGMTFYRDFLIRSKAGFQKVSDVVYLASKANAVANWSLGVWLVVYVGCLLGTAWWGWEETKPGSNIYVSFLICVSIIQDGRKSLIFRGIGYALLVFTLASLLTGCAKDVPRDTVIPSGAVTVNVPVPTCGDDLAKTLFKGPVRPETLPINQLTEADKKDFDKVYRAYVDTIEILTKYAVAQERDRGQAQQQCVAIRKQVDSLNTKTPVIPVQK